VHDTFSVELSMARANRDHSSNCYENRLYFLPVGDITRCKRSINSILHAERSARKFQRWNNIWRSQKAIFNLILTKIDCTFYPVGDISTFKSSFYFILNAECCARHFQRRNNPWRAQIAIIRQIVTRIDCISCPLEIFRRWNAHFTPFDAPNAVHDTLASKLSLVLAKCDH
jgi:hypothetical protein